MHIYIHRYKRVVQKFTKRVIVEHVCSFKKVLS